MCKLASEYSDSEIEALIRKLRMCAVCHTLMRSDICKICTMEKPAPVIKERVLIPDTPEIAKEIKPKKIEIHSRRKCIVCADNWARENTDTCSMVCSIRSQTMIFDHGKIIIQMSVEKAEERVKKIREQQKKKRDERASILQRNTNTQSRSRQEENSKHSQETH